MGNRECVAYGLMEKMLSFKLIHGLWIRKEIRNSVYLTERSREYQKLSENGLLADLIIQQMDLRFRSFTRGEG